MQSFAQVLLAFFKPLLQKVGIPEIRQHVGIVRLLTQSSLIMAFGSLKILLLVGNHGEAMMSLYVVGIGFQHQFVELLRVLDASLPSCDVTPFQITFDGNTSRRTGVLTMLLGERLETGGLDWSVFVVT